MKNEGTEKKRLMIVLIVLVLLIIGLAVGIAIAFSNKEQVATSQSCEEIEDDYEMRICLSDESRDGRDSEKYDAMMEKAVENEEYGLFSDLFEDRVSGLMSRGECKMTFEWMDTLEKKYASRLSIPSLFSLYTTGKQIAEECDNSTRLTYYTQKAEETEGDDVQFIIDDVNWDENGDPIDGDIELDEEE